MDTIKQRGGFRPNSGRKPTGRKMRSMRLTDSEYEQVKEYINAGREDEVEEMLKMEIVDKYGENKAYNGGAVEIKTRSGYSYTYVVSNILGIKTEYLYITSEYKNIEQSQAYWKRENGTTVKGYLPAALTIDDINKAAELLSLSEKRKMKKYRIVKNYDEWGFRYDVPNDENTIIDQDELERLAQDWEKPIEELMDDLEELEE